MAIKQIRESVFETNSSSMHSIVIAKNNPNEQPPYITYDWDKNPNFIIDENNIEWGRGPFEFLNTFENKLCYLIPSVCQTGYKQTATNAEEEFEKILYAVKEILKENNINSNPKITLPKIRQYDYENHKYKKNKETYYGDIDHQSIGTLKGFLNKYKLTYKEFLENPKIQVVIDGDEYCYLYEMFETGILDETTTQVYPNIED